MGGARRSRAPRRPGSRWDRLEALRARGIAALLAHEPARAAESLRARVGAHRARGRRRARASFPVAPELVEALVELGELDEARAVTDRLRELAERQAASLGARDREALRGAGARSPRDGYDDAAARARRGGRRLRRLGLRFDRARALLSLGRAQRRLKKWGAARDVARARRGRVRRARLGRLGRARRAPSWRASARAGRARAAS